MEYASTQVPARTTGSELQVVDAGQYGPAIQQLLDIVNELAERSLRLAERSRSAHPLAPAPASVA